MYDKKEMVIEIRPISLHGGFTLLINNNMKKEGLHIGSMIKSRLDECGHKVAWLSRKIACKRGNIYKIFARSSIDTALLLSISVTLKTNFFARLSFYYQCIASEAEEAYVNSCIVSNKEISIGELIKKKVEVEGIRIGWLAQKLECDRSNIYNIYSRYSIDTKLLMMISLALKTNFFEHFSELYRYTVKEATITDPDIDNFA